MSSTRPSYRNYHSPPATISVAMVMHNEAAVLERCLKSLHDVVDEIVIVHDGPCSDDSLKIAKRYTKKVFVRPAKGTCEGHFPFLQKKCRCDWIMLVDPDEYFSPELRRNIRKLIRDPGIDCYDMHWPTRYGGRLLQLGRDRKFYKRVLFRRSKARLENYLHSMRGVAGKVAKTDIPLNHAPPTDVFSKEHLAKKVAWSKTGAKLLLPKAKLPAYVYLVRAPVYFFLYIFYYFFWRLWLFSGKVGIDYTMCMAKYNWYINIYLFKLRRSKSID